MKQEGAAPQKRGPKEVTRVPISTNNSIRTLEVVEDPRVDLTLPQLEALVDKHFAAFQNFGRRTVEEGLAGGATT